MEISGHKSRSVFERYNMTDERDLHEAGEKMKTYLQKQPRKNKVVTLAGTGKRSLPPRSLQPAENAPVLPRGPLAQSVRAGDS
jgi:hypothetical protein